MRGSDNPYPSLLFEEHVDPANPAAGHQRMFIDTDHVLKIRDSAGTVTPFASSAGAVATDAIFDTKGDLPVGTGADTASKLAAGANGLVLTAASGEATGLQWAVPTVPYQVADCSADVNLSTDTPADATSATLTLAAGTYLLLGVATLSLAGATTYGICYVTNAADTVIAEGRQTVISNSPQTIHAVPTIVSPGTSTVYKIRGQVGTTTTGKILRYSEGSNVGTRLTAIRLL